MKNDYLKALMGGGSHQSGNDFMHTGLGRRYFEVTLPSLIKSIEGLTCQLEKASIDCKGTALESVITKLAALTVSQSDFYRTRMGRLFYEGQIPQLIRAMNDFTESLEQRMASLYALWLELSAVVEADIKTIEDAQQYRFEQEALNAVNHKLQQCFQVIPSLKAKQKEAAITQAMDLLSKAKDEMKEEPSDVAAAHYLETFWQLEAQLTPFMAN